MNFPDFYNQRAAFAAMQTQTGAHDIEHSFKAARLRILASARGLALGALTTAMARNCGGQGT